MRGMDLEAMLPVRVAVTAWWHRVNWEATLQCPQGGSCKGLMSAVVMETQKGRVVLPVEHEKKCLSIAFGLMKMVLETSLSLFPWIVYFCFSADAFRRHLGCLLLELIVFSVPQLPNYEGSKPSTLPCIDRTLQSSFQSGGWKQGRGGVYLCKVSFLFCRIKKKFSLFC